MAFPQPGEDFDDWIARRHKCEYILPDELQLFFDDLAGRMRDALSPYQKDLWFDPPTFWSQPDRYKALKYRRDWFVKAIDIILPLAFERNIDDTPFRWFKRLISGELPRDSDSARGLVDATSRLYLALFGCNGHDIFIWDVDESPQLTPNQATATACSQQHKPEWNADTGELIYQGKVVRS